MRLAAHQLSLFPSSARVDALVQRHGWGGLDTELFLLGFVGLGISIYPYAVPRSVTIWEAAAPPQSQLFMLVGAVVIIPVILVYTGWAYWVFRGKVRGGYH